jgi:hypothetical protein
MGVGREIRYLFLIWIWLLLHCMCGNIEVAHLPALVCAIHFYVMRYSIWVWWKTVNVVNVFIDLQFKFEEGCQNWRKSYLIILTKDICTKSLSMCLYQCD